MPFNPTGYDIDPRLAVAIREIMLNGGALTDAQIDAGALVPAGVTPSGQVIDKNASPVSGGGLVSTTSYASAAALEAAFPAASNSGKQGIVGTAIYYSNGTAWTATGSTATDLRKLAPWYGNTNATRTIVFWGDSTTAQFSQWVPEAGGLLSTFTGRLPGVTWYGRGGSGATLASVIAGNPTTAGGNGFGVATIAAMQADLYVIGFGINDCRGDATIIGSYGSAGQIAKAQALQALFVQAVNALRAAKPTCGIIIRVPNAHMNASTYFQNGVSGQNCMDLYRLTFRGDSALGVPSLESLLTNVLVYDAMALYYNDTAYTTLPGRINADGLHPSFDWYSELLFDIVELLAQPPSSIVDNAYNSQGLANAEWSYSSGAAYGLTFDRIKNNADFEYLFDGLITGGNGTSYMDVSPFYAGYQNDATTTAIFGGAANTNIGSTALPAIAAGDVMVVTRQNGAQLCFVMRFAPGRTSTGNTLRWTDPPNGLTWFTITQNDVISFYRHKWAHTADPRAYIRRRTISAGIKRSVQPRYFRVSLVSSAVGSCVIRGMLATGAGDSDMTGYTLTTADTLLLSGASTATTNLFGGIPLTGATLTPHATEPGRWTIALAGVDFRRAYVPQGLILAAT